MICACAVRCNSIKQVAQDVRSAARSKKWYFLQVCCLPGEKFGRPPENAVLDLFDEGFGSQVWFLMIENVMYVVLQRNLHLWGI
ncbi:hypothetical protein JTE90_025844 [Oedothorax gibbosus]|uniref:Uncharacterized protein n=1 Tax=Oedothorax gibbosus TaxID=931172 RepID=A0AAV6UTY2_9ARAC|nr:hypothetical protein JTE90_025844 [Oedothorax gibbosus]